MTYEDITRPSTERLAGEQHHDPVRGKYRPMRGQAYVLLEEKRSSVIITKEQDPHDQVSHRGKVLALGPPGRMGEHESDPEVPWGFGVGDTIVFCMAVWLDRMRVLEFFGINGRVAVIAQGEVMGVVE